jgi:hypothetical protein
VYGREYAGKKLHFEPSGGLIHATLVMQDKETDSFWSIMTGDAVKGDLLGTRLQELPVGVKIQWRAWKAAHPDTLVLSVGGVEHIDNNPYDNYVRSDAGFRDAEARDKRLPTKAPVFSFQLAGVPYAAPFESFEGGHTFSLGEDLHVFLFRPAGVEVFYSTLAFRSDDPGFVEKDDGWYHLGSGAHFDPDLGSFVGGQGQAPGRLEGFDTFWFNWSMTHPDTRVLR